MEAAGFCDLVISRFGDFLRRITKSRNHKIIKYPKHPAEGGRIHVAH
jgi:hypothetical protein